MPLGPRTILPLIFVLFLGQLFIGSIVTGQTLPGTIASERAASDKNKAKETKKLYKQQCAKCHGVNGAGETTQGQILGATDFTDAEWQERVDDERLDNSITYGRGQMPAFGKKLTPQQITTLVDYLRALKKE